MKKKVLSVVLLLTLFLGLLTACDKVSENGKEKSNNEKSKWVLTYEKEQRSDDYGNLTIVHEGYFEYDFSGNAVSEKYIYSNMDISISHFEFDKIGNIIYKAGIKSDNDKETPCSYKFTYDVNNNCAREYVDWTSSTDDITYEYDEYGNIIKEHSVYSSGSDITETEYEMTLEYDNNLCVQNEITIKTTYSNETNYTYALKNYEYDDNGNKVKETYYIKTDNVNASKNYVEINGKNYMLYSFTEYTYKNISNSSAEQNSDQEETNQKTKLSRSFDKILASGYENNGDFYELVANEKENYNGIQVEIGIIKNNSWLLEPTTKMPLIDDDGTLYGKEIYSIDDVNAKIFYIGNGCFLCESYSAKMYECMENIIYNSETQQYYEKKFKNKDSHICITYNCMTGFYGTQPNYSKLNKLSNNNSLIITDFINYGEKATIEVIDSNTMELTRINIKTPKNWYKIGYVYPISEEIFAVANDYSNHNKIAFFDKNGNNIIDNDYSLKSTSQNIVFNNGECTFDILNINDKAYTITIDKSGKVIYPFESE